MSSMLSIGIALHLFDKLSSPLGGVKNNIDNVTRSIKSAGDAVGRDFNRGIAIVTKTLEQVNKPFRELKDNADRIKGIGQSLALKGAGTARWSGFL